MLKSSSAPARCGGARAAARDLRGRRRIALGRDRRAQDVVEPRLVLADDALHRGRPRHHHRVVLIVAGRRLALRREHADHRRTAKPWMRMTSPIGSSLAEQLVRARSRRSTHDARACSTSSSVKIAPRATSQRLIAQIVGRDAAEARVPVAIAVDHEDAAVDVLGHALDQRHLAADRLGIVAASSVVMPCVPVRTPATLRDPASIQTRLSPSLSSSARTARARASERDDRDHDRDRRPRYRGPRARCAPCCAAARARVRALSD